MKLIFPLFLSLLMVACSSGDSGGIPEVDIDQAKVDTQGDKTVEAETAPEVYETTEYQCRLSAYDKIKNVRTHCSGTYLNKNIFLTAASCFNILDGGVDLLKNTEREYLVSCGGVESQKARAVAIHPHFYTNGAEFHGGYQSDLINPGETISTVKYNDIALVWTEDANLSAYPSLPTDITPKINLSVDEQCHFTGFASENCNLVSGKGCQRQVYESGPIVAMSTCDFGSGYNCFLDEQESEFSTQANPLAYSVSVKRGSALAAGDVGAGMVCKTEQGTSDVLVGIFANINEGQTKNYALVNVYNKSGFVEKFLNLTEAEFVDTSPTYILTDSYKERAQVANEIEAVFTAIPDINFNKIYISEDGFEDAVLFLEYLLENQTQVAAYFRANVIKSIRIDEDTRGFFGWVAGSSQVEVGVQGDTVKDGQTIFINGFDEDEWNELVQK